MTEYEVSIKRIVEADNKTDAYEAFVHWFNDIDDGTLHSKLKIKELPNFD